MVLSAVKVLMKFLELIDQNGEFAQNLFRKLAPPLVTLLSTEPEIQYVALRNINLIVQKRYVDRRTISFGSRTHAASRLDRTSSKTK